MAAKAKVAPKSGTISPSIANKLDLGLAWRRVKLDRPARCFVTHPYLFSWIEGDLTGWLDSIERKIAAGYGRVKSDGELVRRAVESVRAGRK